MSRRSKRVRGKHRNHKKEEAPLIEEQKIEIKEKNVPNGNEVDLDKLFCMNGKKYKLEKLWLKALAIIESSLNPRAYRFEPAFWEKYLKNHPDWKDRDPKIVSASWGIGQIMFTTAWALGLRTQPDEAMAEDLCNPVINIELYAKLLRQNLDKLQKDKLKLKFSWLDMFAVALARYNGGSLLNPGEDGKLRNQSYVDKVTKAWFDLRDKEEKECGEE